MFAFIVYLLANYPLAETILHNFPNNPEMVVVAWCESEFYEKARHISPKEDSWGIFQINKKAWGERAIREGYTNLHDIHDNLNMAKIIYKEHGLAPWKGSKDCLDKKR